MTKTWYPVIDYITCIECGECIVDCPHDVYDTDKAPSPVVKNPEKCVDHCHGCGNLCPAGAITYVGEDTGWTPQSKEPAKEGFCCSCWGEDDFKKRIIVDYLYLDLETCDRCIGTDNILDEVMMAITPALKIAGYEVEYNKIEMKTAEIASRYMFLSSPTIRVNGQDICQSVAENNCGCCSDISGTDVDCRVFEYNDETYEVPPKEMIAEAILNSVFGQSDEGCSCGGYELPENLLEFFEGKNRKSNCSCGDNC